jgi:hypothetical protein
MEEKNFVSTLLLLLSHQFDLLEIHQVFIKLLLSCFSNFGNLGSSHLGTLKFDNIHFLVVTFKSNEYSASLLRLFLLTSYYLSNDHNYHLHLKNYKEQQWTF